MRHSFNKTVVYTAVLGDYDHLNEIEAIDEGFDYICFTDNRQLEAQSWKVVHIKSDRKLTHSKQARKIKILAHKYLGGYDASIWIDANLAIRRSLKSLISGHTLSPMLCLKHPQRGCIYDEAAACIDLNKDNESTILSQIEGYRREGYPKDNGLTANGFLYRRHNNKQVKRLMKGWWKEVKRKSCRDQLSFNYACWKQGFVYEAIDMNVFINDFWAYNSHKA